MTRESEYSRNDDNKMQRSFCLSIIETWMSQFNTQNTIYCMKYVNSIDYILENITDRIKPISIYWIVQIFHPVCSTHVILSAFVWCCNYAICLKASFTGEHRKTCSAGLLFKILVFIMWHTCAQFVYKHGRLFTLRCWNTAHACCR